MIGELIEAGVLGFLRETLAATGAVKVEDLDGVAGAVMKALVEAPEVREVLALLTRVATCEHCGTRVLRKRSRGRWCSDRCRKAATRAGMGGGNG